MTGERQKKLTEDGIKLHDAADFAGMRRAGKLAAEVLDFITPHVEAGVTTEHLDKLCHDYIVGHGDANGICPGRPRGPARN